MNLACLNFSHGDYSGHSEMIRNPPEAVRSAGRQVAIMADLFGPKIRIGELIQEPIVLKKGHEITLSSETFRNRQDRALRFPAAYG